LPHPSLRMIRNNSDRTLIKGAEIAVDHVNLVPVFDWIETIENMADLVQIPASCWDFVESRTSGAFQFP